MKRKYFRRQIMALLIFGLSMGFALMVQGSDIRPLPPLSSELQEQYFGDQTALAALNSLEVKGRAPKTNYRRAQFGNGWTKQGLCDTRNIILKRDMTDVKIDEKCRVLSGILEDPYTGVIMKFQRGEQSSQLVQIDHVVALSDAWQKGAQQLSLDERIGLSNDPLNLMAVDGASNQAKGDGDAATWLPPNKSFRCQYVARQVAVKKKYRLWVTEAEKAAISKVLGQCAS